MIITEKIMVRVDLDALQFTYDYKHQEIELQERSYKAWSRCQAQGLQEIQAAARAAASRRIVRRTGVSEITFR